VLSDRIAVPHTSGVARPVVFLPRGAAVWSNEQLESALLHELVHLRRGDYVTHLIAAIVRAVYWVNPTIWYASRRMEAERERACDDGVVGRVDPIRYAECLMRLAWTGRGAMAQPMLPFVSRSSLRERVSSLLDRAQARRPLGRTAAMAIVAVSALVIGSAGAIEVFGIAKGQGLAAALADPDPIVRRQAAWAMGEAEDPGHVASLHSRLADSDPRVRGVAAWALGEIKDPRSVAPLTALLTDGDARVREMAALAIGEIEDPSGLAALRDAGAAVVSAEARAWAMAQIEHRGGTPEVFAGALQHPHARGPDLPQYLADLRDADPGARSLAAERLGRLDDAAAVPALLDALEDPDPAVRAMAVWALDEINPSRQTRRTAPSAP
jgi:hypothetical protein